MSAFPIRLRLVAAPLWALAAARAWMVERAGAIVVLRVDARNPLPGAALLRELGEAPGVRGLRLVLAGGGGMGFATLAAARRALTELRGQGKLVVVELEHAGNGELYLASVADRVWLRPERPVWALGVVAVMRFWADALARVGVTVDVEAIGEFKSFGEQYSRRFPSTSNRHATGTLIEDLQAELEHGIADARHRPVGAVRAAMAAAPLTAEAAVERGLADAILYKDAADTELDRIVGGERREVSFTAWYRAHRLRSRLAGWMEGAPRVVVLHLDGPVVDGEGMPGVVSIAELPALRMMEALAKDEGVRGVVLAIRSPGGSAAASDAIWRGVKRLGESKPVVAALSDVAASGGYYIAVGAAEIVAEACTLTGSIGVIAARPVVRGALEAVGVHTETLKGAPMADFFTEAAWTPEQRARFRGLLEQMYRAFVSRVAEGRKQSFDDVEPHARGRVWTGKRALALGLIDGLGGQDEAVRRVATRAGLAGARRVDVHIRPTGGRLARLLRSLIGNVLPELRWLPMPGVGARMLMESAGAPLYAWPVELDLE